MSVYLVLRSCCDKDSGVLNLYTALEALKPFKIKFIKYPATRKYGHDHSLLIYEVLGYDTLKRAKFLMIEVVKRLLANNPSCAFLPQPFVKLEYYPIPAVMEIITEDSEMIPYLIKIDERVQWAEKEKYNNDLELSKEFINFEKN